jgi:hypothetical protein
MKGKTLLLLVLVAACGSVPVDNGPGGRVIAPEGVIRGTVTYQGPHPCSLDGHIVGNAVVLVFDRRNPPPPVGLANTAVNFGVVTGDVLFANEPRYTGNDAAYCPKDHGVTDTISASAPFTVSPMNAGSYLVQAFFDYTGDFLPTFKFRNLPERGDVGGGDLDVAGALAHANDPNYLPTFYPVDVGIPVPGTPPGAIPSYTMPDDGFIADDVPVTLGEVLPLARPYFYAASGDDSDNSGKPATSRPSTSTQNDPDHIPIAFMTQDVQLDAPPSLAAPQYVPTYQSKFTAVRLDYGVPAAELANATNRASSNPFHFQIDPPPTGGLYVWNSGKIIPEGNSVPQDWPLVVFAKLVDDDPNTHEPDPQALQAQGGAGAPIVIIEGLTVFKDDLLATVLQSPAAPGPTALADHVTVLVRPAVICIDPANIQQGGVLVTPHLTGPSADPSVTTPQPLFDPKGVIAGSGGLVNSVVQGCLPTGRYQINVVYPTGQAWTTPNEAGTCADAEGPFDPTTSSCTAPNQARPVLYSQGNRAVLEILPASDPQYCAANPVPPQCTATTQ